MKRPWARALLSLGALAGVALALAVGELAVRRARPVPCAMFAREGQDLSNARDFLRPCYRREVVGGRASLVPVRRFTELAARPVLPRHRRAGVTRVAVIGESSGFMLGDELIQQLEGPACGAAHEVLNCAQPASALEHAERSFDEVMQYEPDVVVLVFGHNLRYRFPTDERRIVARQWRNRSCLLSTLAPPPLAAQTPPEPLDARLDAFERFLQRLTRETRQRGVRLVLNTMAANLWVPPGMPRFATPAPLLEASFVEATAGPRAAARVLHEARPEPVWAPYQRFREGEALARAGDPGAARAALVDAVDRDTVGGRAHSRTNELLRRYGREPGVALRDTERALAGADGTALPGWETFRDTCHLLPLRLHAEAAAVSALLPGAPRCEHAPLALEQRFELGVMLEGTLRYAAVDQRRSSWHEAASLAVEQWFARQPAETEATVTAFVAGLRARVDGGQASRMLCAVAEGCFRAGRPEQARALNEQARAADERDPGPWYQRAMFALRGGDRVAARAAAARALALAPGDPEARDLRDRLTATVP